MSIVSSFSQRGAKQQAGSVKDEKEIYFRSRVISGSSNQDRISLTVDELQQLTEKSEHQIIIFDVNGEYDTAFSESRHEIAASEPDHGNREEMYRHTWLDEDICGTLCKPAEAEQLCEQIFGCAKTRRRIHVVNLAQVPKDQQPEVVDSILGFHCQTLKLPNPCSNRPATLFVLEEAHRISAVAPDGETVTSLTNLERLAAQGRAFGVSLWLSTPEPSELSHRLRANL
jgi:hypothetical protein